MHRFVRSANGWKSWRELLESSLARPRHRTASLPTHRHGSTCEVSTRKAIRDNNVIRQYFRWTSPQFWTVLDGLHILLFAFSITSGEWDLGSIPIARSNLAHFCAQPREFRA